MSNRILSQGGLRAWRSNAISLLAVVGLGVFLTGCGDDRDRSGSSSTAEASGGVIRRTPHIDFTALGAENSPVFAPLPGEAVDAYWQRRLDGKPNQLTIDFIQASQLAVDNGQEPAIAAFPIVVTGQQYAGDTLSKAHLDRLRSLNPRIALLAYHAAFDDLVPTSVGPGFDALRSLQSNEAAYLHDASGNRLYISDEAGTRALFDPRSEAVRAALLAAVGEVLAVYPYDGIFLDRFGIRDAMLLDKAGNQYTGAPGQVVSEADQAAKLAALESLAAEIRRQWPMALVIANRDPGVTRHLVDVLGQGGWHPSAVDFGALQWDGAVASLSGPQVAAVEATAPPGLLVHAVQPLSGDRILPDTQPLPGRRSDTVEIQASRGEFEAASVVLRAPAGGGREVSASASELKDAASGAVIPADAVDIRFVKPWYQSFHAWNEIGKSAAGDFRQVLIPELLMKDDGLVRTDKTGERNLVKMQRSGREEYVWVNTPQLAAAEDLDLPADDFPIRDAAVPQPLTLAAGSNKQLWVTVHVPDQAVPGEYVGTLDIKAGGRAIASLPVRATVHPFVLAESRLTHSIYYRAQIVPNQHTISSDSKSVEQMRAELQDLKNHGILNPTLYQPLPNAELLRSELEMRRSMGLNRGPLFYLGLTTTASSLGSLGAEGEAFLRAKLPGFLRQAKDTGFDPVYIYGRDEAQGAELTEQRKLWQVTQSLGAKVFAASYRDAHGLVGDLLDASVIGGNPDREEVQRWHSTGKKAFSYATPQSGPENPYLFRLNYGIVLWANDYDGAMPYAYQHCFGSCWNDLDHGTYRDHNLTYPTVDGAIPTLAFEGLREGVDDLRYLTTLEKALAAAPANSTAVNSARGFLNALKSQVRVKQSISGKYNQNMELDLDAIRDQVVEHLKALTGR